MEGQVLLREVVEGARRRDERRTNRQLKREFRRQRKGRLFRTARFFKRLLVG